MKKNILGISGALLLAAGCSNLPDDHTNRKREEILKTMNAVIAREGVIYPPQTSCEFQLTQKNIGTSGKISAILNCGIDLPILTQSHEIPVDGENFELTLSITNILTDKEGRLDTNSGCTTTQIKINGSIHRTDNCNFRPIPGKNIAI